MIVLVFRTRGKKQPLVTPPLPGDGGKEGFPGEKRKGTRRLTGGRMGALKNGTVGGKKEKGVMTVRTYFWGTDSGKRTEKNQQEGRGEKRLNRGTQKVGHGKKNETRAHPVFVSPASTNNRGNGRKDPEEGRCRVETAPVKHPGVRRKTGEPLERNPLLSVYSRTHMTKGENKGEKVRPSKEEGPPLAEKAKERRTTSRSSILSTDATASEKWREATQKRGLRSERRLKGEIKVKKRTEAVGESSPALPWVPIKNWRKKRRPARAKKWPLPAPPEAVKNRRRVMGCPLGLHA